MNTAMDARLVEENPPEARECEAHGLRPIVGRRGLRDATRPTSKSRTVADADRVCRDPAFRPLGRKVGPDDPQDTISSAGAFATIPPVPWSDTTAASKAPEQSSSVSQAEGAVHRAVVVQQADEFLTSAAIRSLTDPAVAVSEAYEHYRAAVRALDDGVGGGGPICADLACLRRRIRLVRIVLEHTLPQVLRPGPAGRGAPSLS